MIYKILFKTIAFLNGIKYVSIKLPEPQSGLVRDYYKFYIGKSQWTFDEIEKLGIVQYYGEEHQGKYFWKYCYQNLRFALKTNWTFMEGQPK